MQIFITDSCPKKSAEYLWRNPVRARKMITESQQILSCAQVHFGFSPIIQKLDGSPFNIRKSRMNHPVVKWVCESRSNMWWLTRHLNFLLSYYKGNAFKNVPKNIKILTVQSVCYTEPDSFLNFAKADSKGLDFTEMDNVFEAYKLYLKSQGD